MLTVKNKNIKIRSLIIFAVLVTAIFGFSGVANVQAAAGPCADAVGNEAQLTCLQNYVAELMQQIALLQGQQTTTTTTPPPLTLSTIWCHSFNTYLALGSTDQTTNGDVSNLVKALAADHILLNEGTSSTFNEDLRLGVIEFQRKYGIYQTGTVGPLTRAKLNSLYGCKATVALPPTPPTTQTTAQASVLKTTYALVFTNTAGTASYAHIMNIHSLDTANGTFKGAGYYTLTPGLSWDLTGSIASDSVASFRIVYNARNAGYTVNAVGAISGNGTINGTATASDGLSFTFKATPTSNEDAPEPTITPTQPSITVTAPNGGETLIVGQTYDIKWTSNGIQEGVLIDLISANTADYIISGQYSFVASRDGLNVFSWKIPEDIGKYITLTDKFKIRVKGANIHQYVDVNKYPNGFSDVSDNYFDIKSQTTQTTQPTIDHLSTSSASAGNQVTIYGTNLGASAIAVIYPSSDRSRGINVCSYSACTANQTGTSLTFTVPQNTVAGNYDLAVFAQGSSISSNQVSLTINSSTPCFDSDGGDNPNVAGYLTYNGQKYVEDFCYSQDQGSELYGSVGENFCINNGQGTSTSNPRKCTYGCVNGACAPAPTTSIQPTITVTSPNGGENWQIGTTHNITWTSTGVTNVKINLVNRGPGDGLLLPITIVSSVPASQGSYQWTIPTTLLSGNYQIEVVENVGYNVLNRPLADDYSNNYFTISSATIAPTTCTSFTYSTWSTCTNSTRTRTIATSLPSGCTGGNPVLSETCTTETPTINVTSPSGGVIWKAGETQNITWTATGFLGGITSTIKLLKNGSPVAQIAGLNIAGQTSPLLSSGSYSWTIPAGYEGTSNFQVQVLSNSPPYVNGLPISGTSTNFSILPKQITVDSKTCTAGRSCTITWSALGVSQVSISLKLPSGSNYLVASNILATQGSYTFTVPSTFTASDQYKINVSDMDSTISASNNLFVDTLKANLMVRVLSYLVSGASANVSIHFPDSTNYNNSTTGSLTNSLPVGSTFTVVPAQVTGYTSSTSGTCNLSSPGAVANQNYTCDINYTATTPAVTTPPITITSPSGGETFRKGLTYTLGWNAPNTVSQITLQYENTNYTSVGTITSARNFVGQQYYSWTIPTTLSSGTYRIVFVVNTSGTITTINSSNFTIADPLTSQIQSDQSLASVSTAFAKLLIQVQSFLNGLNKK